MDEPIVDRRVADIAARFRRLGMRMPDALIAATGMVHQLTLLSRDVRDFRRVTGLRVRSA